ncbi:MAG: ABC transporter substrate-binding protein [Janthinobacterium lividum]
MIIPNSARRLVLALVALPWLASFHSLSASAAQATAVDAAALSKITLNIGQNNGELEPLYRASGAFDGTPYKIKFSSFNNALDNYTALAAGNVDVSDSAVTTAQQLQQSAAVPWTAATAPIKTILVRVSDYPGSLPKYVVIAGSKSGITQLNANTLKGKKFAYSPGANNYLVYLATLKYFGVKPSELRPVQLDTTANSLALLSNNVDLVSGSIELYGAAIDDGAKIVSSSAKLGLPLLSGILANTDALNDHLKGAAIKDFVVRYIKFQDWFTTHPAAAQAAYVNGRHFTKAQAETAWRSSRIFFVPVSTETVAQAQQVSNLLYDAGAFTKKLDASVIFDDRFSKLVEQTLTDTHFAANLKASLATPSGK